MRQQLLPACRNWALDDAERLLTDDVRSAPLFMTELEKFSTSLLGVEHTRTQFNFLFTCETYQGSIITQVTDDID